MQKKFNSKRLLKHPYTPLILVPLVLFSPLLFDGKALFWGTPLTQFVPWWQWAFDTIQTGHLPLWNPLVGMGAPLIANYQSALFYPPNWLFFLLYLIGGVSALAWGQALVVSFHLIWSSIGMAALGRRLGLGKIAQTVSGLAFGLSGYLVSRAWFASINTSVSWLPWVLLAAYDLVNARKKWPQIIKLGGIIGLQLLSGHAQTTWYTWLLAGFWISFWWWSTESHTRGKFWAKVSSILKTWGRFGISVIIGGCLSAVQILPTAAYLFQSQRASAAEYEAAMTYSFWPWRLLGLVAPNLFGNPAHGDYWGYGNFWEDAIYIGLLPFFLAVGALVKGFLKGEKSATKDDEKKLNSYQYPKSLFIFLLGVILSSILLSLGKNTPVFPWLYQHAPTFDMFQSPTRFSIWLVFALGLLAGYGVDGWKRPTERGLYWTRLGTAGAFAVTLSAGIGGYFLKNVTTDFKPTFVPAIALSGLWGLGAGLLSLTHPQGDDKVRQTALWNAGVVLWVSIDLIVSGWGLNPGIDLDYFQMNAGNREEIQQMLGDGRLYLFPEDEYNIKYDRYFHFESFEPKMSWDNLRGTVLPNMNMMEGIPVVNNYDPLVPARYARWMSGIEEFNLHLEDEMLALMNVSILEYASNSGDFGVRFEPNSNARRLRWVPCGRIVNDPEEAWSLVSSGQVDINHEVILEGQSEPQNKTCDGGSGQVEIISEHPNSISIRTFSDKQGWVVLSDTWYAGWRGWIDGESVPIVHANYLFRAVEVPMGSHLIRLTYRPPWFYLGFTLSFLGVVGVGGYQIRRRLKSRAA